MTKSRDDALKDLLPSVDSPYSVDNLSAEETAALEEALDDGFGLRVPENKALPLPPKINSGLLHYSFFVADTSKYHHEENQYEFWAGRDDEEPAPFEWFPLRFVVRRLRLYFENQLHRFRAHVGGVGTDNILVMEYLAEERLFRKPWYEFHAVHLLEWIEDAKRDAFNNKNVNLSVLAISGLSGELGRLVEQYYWRFRFERAAVSGVGARKGASRGGKTKSEGHRVRQTEWQRRASDIWDRHPDWRKLAVAKNIKKQLGEALTAKHIARYIKNPKS
jgi:hypothetical protein